MRVCSELAAVVCTIDDQMSLTDTAKTLANDQGQSEDGENSSTKGNAKEPVSLRIWHTGMARSTALPSSAPLRPVG